MGFVIKQLILEVSTGIPWGEEFKINDVLIEDEKKILQLKDFKKNILKLSYGKKNHFLVKII